MPAWTYAFAAPVGVVPCPTLALLTGFALMAGGFDTRPWALGVAVMALLYAAFGVAVLGVWLDVGLAMSGLGLLVLTLTSRQVHLRKAPVLQNVPAHPVGAERARIDAFLALKRIALVGASSHSEHFSRAVMRELLARGIDVVPIHPSADTVEGRRAFAGLECVNPPVEGVLVMTPRQVSADVVEQAALLGLRRVWLHRGAGPGAVSDEALAVAAEHGLELVSGRCPLMFIQARPSWVHQLHAALLKLAGQYPK